MIRLVEYFFVIYGYVVYILCTSLMLKSLQHAIPFVFSVIYSCNNHWWSILQVKNTCVLFLMHSTHKNTWRSLSLFLIIVIIDILLILYVKVFIKLGNTSFEHFFSSLLYNLKVIKFNYTLFGFIYDLLRKRFESEVWLHILWHEFWDMEKCSFEIYVLGNFRY